MINFKAFQGTVTMISEISIGENGEGECCYKLMTVENRLRLHCKFRYLPHNLFC